MTSIVSHTVHESTTKALRVALCADFQEERWPSMDRVAAMLVESLRCHHAGAIEMTRVAPPFTRRASRAWAKGGGRTAFTIDRALNRFWDYPHHVGKLDGAFDVFHVIDHS